MLLRNYLINMTLQQPWKLCRRKTIMSNSTRLENSLHHSCPSSFIAALLLFCLTPAQAQNFGIITNLVSFNGTNGQQPSGPLLQSKNGNFYGTTLYGGTNAVSSGTLFKLTASGTFSNIFSFNIANGSNPNSGLIEGADGNLYGTTDYGGAYTNLDTNHNGFGTIFKTTTNGILNTLASFNGNTGKNPNALVETSPGIFLGTANSGGAYSNFDGFGFGSLFKTDTNSLLTNLLSFNDTNGAGPSTGLTMGSNGTLYGTTTSGGTYEYGTVFRLAANDTISAQFIFNFTNGAVPSALIFARDGNLYGTTTFGGVNQYGTIFKLTTNLAYTTLLNFNGTNGAAPTALIQGADGNFYGLTAQGGAYGYGNFFEFTTNGVLRPLYNFTSGSDGNPAIRLLQGKDGNFYGTSSYGGTAGRGNVFKLSVYPLPTVQSLGVTNGIITITWAAVPTFTYNVQYVTNLTQTNWIVLKSVTANSALGTVTDPIASQAHRFYRISLPY